MVYSHLEKTYHKNIFDKSFDDELRQLYKNESHIFDI